MSLAFCASGVSTFRPQRRLRAETLETRWLLSGSPPDEPLLAVPPDDSVDPLVECSGVHEDFCLPESTESDFEFDFYDFLIFSANFGMTDADWSHGDFDGDSEVTFSDFLIFSANYGS